ncbi:MAG: sigma-70 family RNA polymerase sigma factor [Kiritimatiellae bacterium]|nr:sigma-70 family RNA polymerase sigma factor [Kiritimatiellia bacterium]
MEQALRCQDACKAYAYGLLRDWHLAEDTVQEAVIVVMQKWATFRPGTSMYAWMRTIVRNKALQRVRARQRNVPLPGEELMRAVDRTLEEHFDEAFAERQRRMLPVLQACLARLGARYARLLERFYLDSASYRDLARAYRVGVEAIRKSLYRARKAVRDCTLKRWAELEAAE